MNIYEARSAVSRAQLTDEHGNIIEDGALAVDRNMEKRMFLFAPVGRPLSEISLVGEGHLFRKDGANVWTKKLTIDHIAPSDKIGFTIKAFRIRGMLKFDHLMGAPEATHDG